MPIHLPEANRWYNFITIMRTAKLKLVFKKPEWSYVIIWFLAIVAAVLVLIWQLADTTFGRASAVEKSAIAASSSWHAMLANALFLPYKFIEWILLQFGAGHLFTVRLASVFFALIGIWIFLSLARHWFSWPAYVLGTVLYGSSLWQLHFGRLAVPAILYSVAPLAIIRILVWLRKLKKSESGNYSIAGLLAIAAGLTLYVPGIWLIWLILLVWQRKKLPLLLKSLPTLSFYVAGSLFILILVPLIFSFAHNPQLLRAWIDFSTVNGGLIAVLHRFADWPVYLLGYGPHLSAAYWLGRQPILGIFPAAMTLFGGYYYVRNFRLRQAQLIGLVLAAAWVLFALSDGALVGLAAGLVFLLTAAGIGYALKLWRDVFPRNPIAHSVALFLVIVASAITVTFTTRSYFVAWHFHPETRAAFSIKL